MEIWKLDGNQKSGGTQADIKKGRALRGTLDAPTRVHVQTVSNFVHKQPKWMMSIHWVCRSQGCNAITTTLIDITHRKMDKNGEMSAYKHRPSRCVLRAHHVQAR